MWNFDRPNFYFSFSGVPYGKSSVSPNKTVMEKGMSVYNSLKSCHNEFNNL